MPKVVVTLDDGDIKLALAEYVRARFPALATGLVTLLVSNAAVTVGAAITATVACSQRESSSQMDR